MRTPVANILLPQSQRDLRWAQSDSVRRAERTLTLRAVSRVARSGYRYYVHGYNGSANPLQRRAIRDQDGNAVGRIVEGAKRLATGSVSSAQPAGGGHGS